uniref:Uncharacterized protein n=1 Tax=Octopus bimaculoides TaxID=37653 RepID=A0A0L8G0G4_OCTBM
MMTVNHTVSEMLNQLYTQILGRLSGQAVAMVQRFSLKVFLHFSHQVFVDSMEQS